VRLDRSAFPEAISRAAVLIASVPSRIWPTMSWRLVDCGVGVVLEFSEQALVVALHLLRQVAFRERLEHLRDIADAALGGLHQIVDAFGKFRKKPSLPFTGRAAG
jgi:hypothetical protein